MHQRQLRLVVDVQLQKPGELHRALADRVDQDLAFQGNVRPVVSGAVVTGRLERIDWLAGLAGLARLARILLVRLGVNCLLLNQVHESHGERVGPLE